MKNTIHHNPRPVAQWPDAPPQHRANVTGFCNAIGAACITPPAGISPSTFERLCGGD